MKTKTFQQHLRNEELLSLEWSWRRLTWRQRQAIIIPLRLNRFVTACAEWLPLTLEHHTTRRRVAITYIIYPAHWLRS